MARTKQTARKNLEVGSPRAVFAGKPVPSTKSKSKPASTSKPTGKPVGRPGGLAGGRPEIGGKCPRDFSKGQPVPATGGGRVFQLQRAQNREAAREAAKERRDHWNRMQKFNTFQAGKALQVRKSS